MRSVTFADDDSDMYALFSLAENLGQTVTELLTGRKTPLTNVEYLYWLQYYNRKAELQEAANKPKKKDGQATQEFKKTMGNSQTAM